MLTDTITLWFNDLRHVLKLDCLFKFPTIEGKDICSRIILHVKLIFQTKGGLELNKPSFICVYFKKSDAIAGLAEYNSLNKVSANNKKRKLVA